MSSDTKQVIVVRKDLKMRRGKEIAQGAHAAMAFITRRLEQASKVISVSAKKVDFINFKVALVHHEWLCSSYAKVCVKVNSEKELTDIFEKAKAAGIEAHLITDAGRTEFKGVPTKTCCAIGPDRVELIDQITGHLELY